MLRTKSCNLLLHGQKQSCSVSKKTFDLTVTRGTLWSDKNNNTGTFEQIVEPKRPSDPRAWRPWYIALLHDE